VARGDRQVSLTDIIRAGAGGPEVKSGVAALQSGAMFAPGRLDQIRAASGLPAQGDIRQATAESLTSAAEETYVDPSETPLVQDLSALLQGIKSRQAQTSANLQAIDTRDSDDLGSAPTAPKTITDQLSDLSKDLSSNENQSAMEAAAGLSGQGELISGSDTTDDAMANQQAQTDAAGTTSTTTETTTDTTTDTTQEDSEGGSQEAYNPYGVLLEKAMADVSALRGEDPNKKSKEDYMKEFAEATGVKIDGEPDKSHALMAFGLALMQNKAGKGFNVSNMLGAVGEAGEKAMPAFQKAKEQARAERIAAGKYALGEVKAADKQRIAQLSAAQERVTDLMTKTQDYVGKQLLAQQKHGLEMEKLRIEKQADKEIKEIESGGKKFEVTGMGTYAPLTSMPNIKINTAIRKTDGQEVLTKPLQDVELLSKGYADTLDGISSVDNISALIDEAAKAQAGGVTGQKLFEFIDGRMKALGFSEGLGVGQTVDGKKLGPLAEADAIRRRLIFQYKRFLTQETGNGISNVDIQNLEAAIGNIDFFTNPQEALVKLRETRKLFEASRDALQRQLVRFGDQDLYLAPSQFDKVQEKIGQAALTGVGMGREGLNVSENDDGITVIKLS